MDGAAGLRNDDVPRYLLKYKRYFSPLFVLISIHIP